MWIDVGVACAGSAPRITSRSSIIPTTRLPARLARRRPFGVVDGARRSSTPGDQARPDRSPSPPHRRLHRHARRRRADSGVVRLQRQSIDVATQALWALAQREGREAKFLTPAQAAAAMTHDEGFAVNAWAGEPTIAQPMAFCWDDRGRLWIAENLDYETRGRGFSGSGNSRIRFSKTPIATAPRTAARSSWKASSFRPRLPSDSMASSSARRRTCCSFRIAIVTTRRTSPDIEVRLTGWGIRDRHEVAEQPALGARRLALRPPGYCSTSSKVRKPAAWRALYKAGEPFPDDILEGRRHRDQRRRLALPPDERPSSKSSRTASAIPGASTTTPRASCSSARA